MSWKKENDIIYCKNSPTNAHDALGDVEILQRILIIELNVNVEKFISRRDKMSKMLIYEKCSKRIVKIECYQHICCYVYYW